jgi:hypothetical protein
MPGTLYHRGWTKWRCVGLEGVLPEAAHAPQQVGFEVPQGRWVCGPLRRHLKWPRQRPIWDLVAPSDARVCWADRQTGGRALSRTRRWCGCSSSIAGWTDSGGMLNA